MSSGQAAATAPAKTPLTSHEEISTRHVEAPTFSSLGDTSSDRATGDSKKWILIAATILVAAAAVGYAGWSKLHSAPEAPVTQRLTASPQAAPVQLPQPVPAAVQPPVTPASAQHTASTPANSQPASSASALPVEQGPDITLSTTEAHPPVPKKVTSIVAPNTVIRTPAEAKTPELIVVKNNAPKPAPSRPAEDAAQPPALGSLGVASSTDDQAITGIVSTPAVNLPRPAQKLKVSQGVSQGLLIKSVPPEYPQQARQMRIQGTVELLASIGKEGSITSVKLIKGDSVLSRAAMDAVRQWKYKPYYLNDQPVEIQTQITVNFKLP